MNDNAWWNKIKRLFNRDLTHKNDISLILHDAEKNKILNADMVGMIERILQVSDMQVREVMVLKNQMTIINATNSLEEILSLVIESGHSRFPVYDPDSDDVIGMLLAKDLLKCVFHRQEFAIKDFIRPVIFTPQTKRLDILLREFRVNHNHLAVVLDEYGYIAGLITIEDILEQIVGDIDDEYDIDEEEISIRQLDEVTYIIKASTSIDEFNAYFKANFSGEKTIAHLIQTYFSHVPHRGETVIIEKWKFKVLHSDNKRIYLLEVREV